MQTELAYTAGLIDGEGCFSITIIATGMQTTLRVSMTNRTVIDWLHKTYGGTVHKNAGSGSKEDTYTWQKGKRAEVCEITEALLPYLKVKRLPAMIMLEFCRKFPSMSGTTYSEEKVLEMRKYSEFMSVANGKGPGSEERKETFLNLIVSGGAC